MDQRITHILVPVDSDDDTRAAQLAALRLAAADNAMVTLLYVHDRHARLRSEAGIDSIANLHQVMSASPQDFLMTPTYPDHKKNQSLEHLHEARGQLSLQGFDESLIRTAYRCGDAFEETLKYIDEAGVEVVVIQSPGSLKSPILRRLARELQRNCPCQLQIVHPAHNTNGEPHKWSVGKALNGPFSFLPTFVLKLGWPTWRKADP